MIVVKLSLVCKANCYRLLSGDNTFGTGTHGRLARISQQVECGRGPRMAVTLDLLLP